MYAYIKGKYVEMTEDGIVVEAGGIGYNIKMPLENAMSMPSFGSDVKIYTYTSVREDAMWLYGFMTKEELTLFKQLISVNGVGPKGAQAILAAIPVADLKFAIYSGDVKRISKAPGIGTKSAERIILDLKGKISFEDTLNSVASNELAKNGGNVSASIKDATEALIALGYSATDATKVISGIEGANEMSVEEILQAALQKMAFI